MPATAYVGVSLDGFLARPDGTIDWLPAPGPELGFAEFMAGIDDVVMGRRTWEFVAAADPWYYGDTPVVVLSSRPIARHAHTRSGVRHVAGDPAQVVATLAADGLANLHVDGGVTVQRFLRAGLIHLLVITTVSVLIGQGRPLFGPLDLDVHLTHVRTRSFDNGMVQSEYTVDR